MTRARMSLPTPLSPVSSSLASDRAAHSTSALIALMAGLVPIMLSIVDSIHAPDRARGYQPFVSRENAPKVRGDATNVVRMTWPRNDPPGVDAVLISGARGRRRRLRPESGGRGATRGGPG